MGRSQPRACVWMSSCTASALGVFARVMRFKNRLRAFHRRAILLLPPRHDSELRIQFQFVEMLVRTSCRQKNWLQRCRDARCRRDASCSFNRLAFSLSVGCDLSSSCSSASRILRRISTAEASVKVTIRISSMLAGGFSSSRQCRQRLHQRGRFASASACDHEHVATRGDGRLLGGGLNSFGN